MGAIYQLTFFLALAILAIVITIFVFAVSLLGRAMEAAARGERDKLTERKENNAKEMEAMQKDIEEAKESGRVPTELIRKLKKLNKIDKRFEKKLKQIRQAPELLTVKGGVAPCSTSLLAALILAGVAWYLSSIQVFTWIIPVLIWIVGLAAIAYSISRIYQCVKVIESVAITSEETAGRRLAQAVKGALEELEEEKKPELALTFKDKEPPFHVERGAQMTIEVAVTLVRGGVGREPIAYFLAPPGFDFPDMETWLQPEEKAKIGGYISAKVEWQDVRKGISRPGKITVKAPSDKEGSFSLYYRLTCEGFDSGRRQFDVIVE